MSARLRIAKREKADQDEINALEHAIELYNAETAAKSAIREAQATLDLSTLKKYGNLAEDDVKNIVLDDKWRSTVTRHIQGEVNSLTLALVDRIQVLGERYAETVSGLDQQLTSLESRVMEHLDAMGVEK